MLVGLAAWHMWFMRMKSSDLVCVCECVCVWVCVSATWWIWKERVSMRLNCFRINHMLLASWLCSIHLSTIRLLEQLFMHIVLPIFLEQPDSGRNPHSNCIQIHWRHSTHIKFEMCGLSYTLAGQKRFAYSQRCIVPPSDPYKPFQHYTQVNGRFDHIKLYTLRKQHATLRTNRPTRTILLNVPSL